MNPFSISATEKGRCHIKLSVEVPGGHASTPYPESAIGILSAAIHK